jgi:hypothetical protein
MDNDRCNADVIKKEQHLTKKEILQHIYELQYASSKNLRSNEQIIKAVVAKYGVMLQYASKSLRDNEEIVKLAVNQDGEALKYASKSLRNNEEIVKLAVNQDETPPPVYLKPANK